MINLLPYDAKKRTKAARANVKLMMALVLTLLAIGVGVFFVLDNYNKITAGTTTKTTGNNSTVQAQAQNYKAQLLIVKSIMQNEVKYSSIILKIASAMPQGTVLKNIELNDSMIGSKTVPFTIYARSSGFERNLQTSLQGTGIVNSLDEIKTATMSGGIVGYQYSTTFNAIISLGSGGSL